MWKYLLEKMTGEDMFNCINNYITKHKIEWIKCTDICTDCPLDMMWKIKGVITRIMEISTSATKYHCVLHR